MFHRLIAWIWLFHILASTTGVHVHRIYCLCTGDIAYKLVAQEQHGCGSTEEVILPVPVNNTSCCSAKTAIISKPEKASCCKSAVSYEPTLANSCGVGSDCMDDKVIFLKLDSDLIVEKVLSYELTELQPTAFLPQIFFYPERVIVEKQEVPACFRGPPLKPYGRYLLPYVQAWLC